MVDDRVDSPHEAMPSFTRQHWNNLIVIQPSGVSSNRELAAARWPRTRFRIPNANEPIDFGMPQFDH
jgi:hypothetical protein